MAKLKQHKLLVILALVLVIALVVLAFMVRFFKSTRPLFPDMTDLQVDDGIYWTGGDAPINVKLMPGVDFELEELESILADCRISPSFYASRTGGAVALGNAYFTLIPQAGAKGQRESSILTIGTAFGKATVLRSRFAWELENRDEIYTRLLDLFGDQLSA